MYFTKADRYARACSVSARVSQSCMRKLLPSMMRCSKLEARELAEEFGHVGIAEVGGDIEEGEVWEGCQGAAENLAEKQAVGHLACKVFGRS